MRKSFFSVKFHKAKIYILTTSFSQLVVVEVFSAFGLTVVEKKIETLMMWVPDKRRKKGVPPPPPPPPLDVHAAGQTFAQTSEFRYLGG